jgi:hypothetical protein
MARFDNRVIPLGNWEGMVCGLRFKPGDLPGMRKINNFGGKL